MNRLYFFTGTGNSLSVAENIGKALPECDIVAIQKGMNFEIPAGYERVGFVFPNYAGGPPSLVADFVQNMMMPKEDIYLFAVATYGGNARSLNSLVTHQFAKNGMQLDYCSQIISYVNWKPKDQSAFNEISEKTTMQLQVIIDDIQKKRQATFPALDETSREWYDNFMVSIHDSDKNYSVNSDCISCGVCTKVCPAKNVSLENEKPSFHHHCEGCLACVNFCPQGALAVVGNPTTGKRYTHPQVEHSQIAKYYVENITDTQPRGHV